MKPSTKPTKCVRCRKNTWQEFWHEWRDKDLGLVGGIFCQTCLPIIKKEKPNYAEGLESPVVTPEVI